MKGSPEVIASLQRAFTLEWQINVQCRNDQNTLKFWGVGKNVRGHIKKFGDQSHEFLQSLRLRIQRLGAPAVAGSVNTGETTDPEDINVEAIFDRQLILQEQIMQVGLEAIGTAVEAGDETTAEKLRHIEERHEDAVAWLEKQKRQIRKLGVEQYLTTKI